MSDPLNLTFMALLEFVNANHGKPGLDLDAAAHFGVDVEKIRRGLAKLEEQGLIRRTK